MKGNQIDGQPVTEEQLLKEGYRKYTGEGIDIFYNKDIVISYRKEENKNGRFKNYLY